MVSKEIRGVRCDDLLRALVADGKRCVFFTLTTPDVVDIHEIRTRWRGLRHDLVRRLGGAKYVMNYEIHPKGHGWHIHGVFDRFVPLREFLPLIRSYGFGRVDFRRVTSLGVSQYLTKHCLKAYRGISLNNQMEGCKRIRLRLVNVSRGLPKLDDYHYSSDYLERKKKMIRELGRPASFNALRVNCFWSDVSSMFGFHSMYEGRDFVGRLYDLSRTVRASDLIRSHSFWYNLGRASEEYFMNKLGFVFSAILPLCAGATANDICGFRLGVDKFRDTSLKRGTEIEKESMTNRIIKKARLRNVYNGFTDATLYYGETLEKIVLRRVLPRNANAETVLTVLADLAKTLSRDCLVELKKSFDWYSALSNGVSYKLTSSVHDIGGLGTKDERQVILFTIDAGAFLSKISP